jgi:hypothetical protein
MHYYRFVRCKTPRCFCKWYVAHQELPVLHGLIDYPHEWFPIEVQCARCQQKSEYEVNEIQSETSYRRLHPRGWQPLLPDAPAPEEIN